MAKKLVIPTTTAELEELMADEGRVGTLLANGQFLEVMQAYAASTDRSGEIAEQIAAQVQTGLVTALKDMGVTRPNLTPGVGGAIQNAAYNPHAVGVQMDSLGFKDLGDFARNLVWIGNNSPDPTKLAEARKIMAAYSSIDPGAGGFLIPETQRAEILSLTLEQAIVRPRATVITMDSLTQSVPYVDSTTNQGSVFGGMIFYWTPESGEILSTSSKFGRVKLEANKLTGGARVPNELYADGRGLSSFLNKAIPTGLAFYEDVAFLTGVGAGEPLGAHNSPALVTVAKETNQPADTIVTANILKIFSRMLASSQGRAVWLVNQTDFEQLMSLSIAVGTGGAPIALMNIRDGSLPTMLTRPVVITEKVPVLGDAKTVGLYDFAYYLIGDRQAISMESSGHSRFMNDETELRVIERVDGRPWIQSAIQPKNGDPLSPFVVLGTV